ncbi:MAG: HlyD family efflux transporter periplasmic adaptor subunit [Alphaproteobacteria bacterium]|nr:HlyD family efflux transporter periplasmic adaptor subunit [Alphaproteobacteria bacterium]
MRWYPFLLFLLVLSACEPEGSVMNGYVEGEYLYIAPTSAGLLAELPVVRGQTVNKGQPLFSIEKTALQAAYALSLAEVAQALAKWNDLLKGSRPEEIEIIMQQQEQARAALDVATKDYVRARSLVESKAVSQQTLDGTKSVYEAAQARVAELSAQLKKAALGAREDEVAAAQAAMNMAEQKVVQTEKQIHDAAPLAPTAGTIQDTFFNIGEYVGAGVPVVSLLPPDKVKVRFFVPQASLSQVPLGRKVRIACDGCDHTVDAKITYVSASSEYTPPVIYSIGSRDKLVFMVEAIPFAYDALLKPGLPVDIELVSP